MNSSENPNFAPIEGLNHEISVRVPQGEVPTEDQIKLAQIIDAVFSKHEGQPFQLPEGTVQMTPVMGVEIGGTYVPFHDQPQPPTQIKAEVLAHTFERFLELHDKS